MASQFRNNTDQTAAVMDVLRDARLSRGYSWKALTALIDSEFDYRITEDQYRACEQGLTRKVPLDVVIFAAKILDLDPIDVLGNVLS